MSHIVKPSKSIAILIIGFFLYSSSLNAQIMSRPFSVSAGYTKQYFSRSFPGGINSYMLFDSDLIFNLEGQISVYSLSKKNAFVDITSGLSVFRYQNNSLGGMNSSDKRIEHILFFKSSINYMPFKKVNNRFSVSMFPYLLLNKQASDLIKDGLDYNRFNLSMGLNYRGNKKLSFLGIGLESSLTPVAKSATTDNAIKTNSFWLIGRLNFFFDNKPEN